jgi:negative regulator of flagellin synthesis FlgM
MGIAAMVIDSNTGIHSSGGSPRNRIDSGTTGAKSNADTPAPKAEKADVSLSTEARNLSRLESSIQAAPDVDSDKVARIRQAIEDGTFEINAESIANRMLEQDDLLG